MRAMQAAAILRNQLFLMLMNSAFDSSSLTNTELLTESPLLSLIHIWLNTGRVENLGTEVSQLCSLLEVQLAYCLSVLYDTRVAVVHYVDIGPDLNFVSWESCTDKRCGVVATATLQIVNLRCV